MCDEREPLLAYLYGEGDPDERQRVESHLQSCEGCRDELAGLRSVREDLLAWDVPDYESVWKPFTPARPVWSWRDVPVWTMAAAATVMLALGAAGSVATNTLIARSAGPAKPAPALMTAGLPVTPSANVAKPIVASAVTPADLAALEVRVLDEVSHRAKAAVVETSLTPTDYDKLLQCIVELNKGLAASNKRVNDLSATVAQMAQNQQGGR